MSLLKPLLRCVSVSPTRIFWAFALVHLFLWTLVPALVCQNLPLDVIEGYAWGKEWLMGTSKHPPMQAWLLELFYDLSGKGRWAPYFVSQAAIVIAFWAVWQTGRRIVGETEALIGVLLLEGIAYYNFTSPEFNPNVLQLPFWALMGWSFHKAVKDNRLIDWLLLGVWAAGGMYAKYSSGLFIVMLTAALLAHRDGRRRLAAPGPYIAAATSILLFLPHAVWLWRNDFIPLTYTQGRFERCPDHYSAAITTLLMVAGQCLALTFMILLLIVLYDRSRAPDRRPTPSFDRVFLGFAAFGPFIAMFCVALVFGYHIRDMWETPFWNFIGLWAMAMLRPALRFHDVRRFSIAWVFIFWIGLVAFIGNETLSPYVNAKPKRTNFPGKNLAESIDAVWRQKFHSPLTYVIGDTWPAGNVAWYSQDRPHVMMDGDPTISPWIDRADLVSKGGVILWCIKCARRDAPDARMPDHLRAAFPQAQNQAPLALKRMTSANVPPAVIGWAIVPPRAAP